MRIRLGVMIGCFTLIGAMFPVWRYLDQKEKEAQAKYEIYEQIHQQEEKKNQEISRVNRIKEQQNKVEKELEPYENLLDSIQTVRETYIPQKDIPLTDFQDAFLKAPYLLDVDSMIKTYEYKRNSVGLNTAAGNFTGFLGKIFFSTVTEVTQDQAGEDAVLRVQFSQYLYKQLEELEQKLEVSLVEYNGIADYRQDIIAPIDEGPLLGGIQTLQHVGGITGDEKTRMDQAEEEAKDLLTKYEFLLNVYYDFNKDLMMQSSNNELLLDKVMRVREKVSELLGDCDRSKYGYTYEEKAQIVKTVTDQWMELIDVCYDNEDIEYHSNWETLYADSGWHDAYFQWLNDSSDQKIPRRILPHYEGESPYKKLVTVYFSSDSGSSHHAYYVKVKQNKYYYYMTDRGEEITYYDSGAEDLETVMKSIDLVYKYMVERPDHWESIAGSYL